MSYNLTEELNDIIVSHNNIIKKEIIAFLDKNMRSNVIDATELNFVMSPPHYGHDHYSDKFWKPKLVLKIVRKRKLIFDNQYYLELDMSEDKDWSESDSLFSLFDFDLSEINGLLQAGLIEDKISEPPEAESEIKSPVREAIDNYHKYLDRNRENEVKFKKMITDQKLKETENKHQQYKLIYEFLDDNMTDNRIDVSQFGHYVDIKLPQYEIDKLKEMGRSKFESKKVLSIIRNVYIAGRPQYMLELDVYGRTYRNDATFLLEDVDHHDLLKLIEIVFKKVI